MAFYLENEERGDFFDSYGDPPGALAPEFEKFLKRNVRTYSFSDKRLQGDYSTVCGQYCLFYLYHRCRGYDPREIVRMFGKNRSVNDVLVNDFVVDKFNTRSEVIDFEYLINQIARPFKVKELF